MATQGTRTRARPSRQPARAKTLSERANELEDEALKKLDKLPVKSPIYMSGDVDPVRGWKGHDLKPGQYLLMGDDPRLERMPERPTLIDFYRLRVREGLTNHMLQSARLAIKNGYDEKTVFACLIHDISIGGFIQGDHGYWGAQLIEPYVSEEVAWAVRLHQVLRFYPDESVGYRYPEGYVRAFGPDFTPEPYIEAAYKEALNHKWYMTSRLITVNDLYTQGSFTEIDLEQFSDIIGRNFKQPKEGLGFDGSPVAHMWRTIMRPTRAI